MSARGTPSRSWNQLLFLLFACMLAGSWGCSDNLTAPRSPSEPPPRLECTIPQSDFYDGGPGPDGIPALDFPEVARDEAAWQALQDTDRVLGITVDGEARAYPLAILWWHEMVNDTLGGRNILVSYCPLTGSGLAFDPIFDGELKIFGVSGLLYENNLIMFDRQTRSLWNQLLLGSQCGPDRGKALPRIPIIETTWSHWRALHPNTTVVTRNTGWERNYDEYPYGDYDREANDRTLFPSSPWDESRPPKELVLGVHDDGDAAAYPFGMLAEAGPAAAINDQVGTRPIFVTYVDLHRTARAFDRRVNGTTLTFSLSGSGGLLFEDAETGSRWNARGEATAGPLAGERLEPVADAYTLFWFAWSVFHPETRLPNQ
jgi:hypothetical protein